jgi:hypothetical protein
MKAGSPFHSLCHGGDDPTKEKKKPKKEKPKPQPATRR